MSAPISQQGSSSMAGLAVSSAIFVGLLVFATYFAFDRNPAELTPTKSSAIESAMQRDSRVVLTSQGIFASETIDGSPATTESDSGSADNAETNPMKNKDQPTTQVGRTEMQQPVASMSAQTTGAQSQSALQRIETFAPASIYYPNRMRAIPEDDSWYARNRFDAHLANHGYTNGNGYNTARGNGRGRSAADGEGAFDFNLSFKSRARFESDADFDGDGSLRSRHYLDQYQGYAAQPSLYYGYYRY